MKDEFIENLLIKAHQDYVDWWLPIDVSQGSTLAPMSFLRFLEYILIFDDKNWFDRWLGDFDMISRREIKRVVLQRIVNHHKKMIDLHNKKEPFRFLEK